MNPTALLMSGEEAFRGLCLAALLLNVGISAYYRRRARVEGGTVPRRAEGGRMVALRSLVALPLLFILLAYVLRPAWVAWAQVPLPDAVRWAGGLLAVGVAPFTHWVLRTIGRNISETVLTKPSHELVTDGPYRRIRHPLYTAGLALLIGMSLLAANAVMAALVLVAAVLIVRIVIPKEEAALLERFGAAYQAYRRRTGRLLPSISVDRS